MESHKAVPEEERDSASHLQGQELSKTGNGPISQTGYSIEPKSTISSALSGLDKTIAVLAGFIVLLGLSVLIGWHTHNLGLIQVAPNLVPMQYNTALAFVLSGAGLLLLERGWARTSVVCGIIVFPIGALTLIQYISGVSIGLDEMLMRHYVTVATSHPGRMAPNTALSFSLAGAALILAGLASKTFRSSLIISMFGSLILALGAVALYGYLGGLETAYGWGNLTRMAVHTAAGFMAMGICVIRLAWVKEIADTASTPQWLPVPIVVSVVAVLMLMEQTFLTSHNWQSEGRVIVWLLMGALLGLSLAMAQMYQQKVVQLRESNQRLKEEIVIREGMEEELKKTNRRYDLASSVGEIGIWDWNPVINVVYWNKEVYGILGYTPEVDKPSYELYLKAVHPSDRKLISDSVNEALTKNKPYKIDSRIVTPGGVEKVCRTVGEVIFDQSGKPIRMMGTFQDITESKRREEENLAHIQHLTGLNRINKAFEPAFDMQAALPVALNEIMSIFDCDRAFLLYPLDTEAKTYKIPFEQTKPEYPGAFSSNKNLPVTEEVATIFKATLDSSAPVSMNLVEGITDAAQLKEYDIKTQLVVAIHPETGKPWMLGMHQCSHAREWTKEEQALFHAISLVISDKLNNLLLVRNLSESEERHRVLFNNASVGIGISSENGQIIDANETLLKMLGYSRRELMSMDLKELFIRWNDAQALAKRLSRNNEIYDFETVFRKKDGARFDASLTVTHYDLKGQKVYQAVILDITKRKEAEKAIIAAKEEAERANKAKTVFLSSISHEIRTPLTSVLGFSRLLEWDTENPLNDSQKQLLARIADSGNQLLDLINNVLDLSKIESGAVLLSIENHDMEPLAVMATTALTPLAEKRGVTIIRKKSDENLLVQADRPHLLQVMINLLSNAIKYNKRGGETVLSYAKLDEKTLRISVSDTGTGIPEDKIADLFKPFNRLGREGANIDGVGIGLAIAKRAVELMGGVISVESEVGKGSTFHIDLPLGGKPKQETERPATEKRGKALKSKERKGVALYIEDNKDNVDLMRLFLRGWPNIKMLSVDRAEEGIEIARNQKPDLILMDIGLPGMSGIEALKELKRHEETRRIPVLAVSAKAMKHEVQAGTSAGFDGYITKPFEAGMLLETLDGFFSMWTKASET